MTGQQQIDSANAAFWNELCGTSFAQRLGIKNHHPDSLRTFDNAYFNYYPYLLTHVPVHTMKGKKVLEIGLGYGSLAQKIAESGADYTGLDIAAGPVRMVEHRLAMAQIPGKAIQGSMLENSFADNSFDCVVSIGCFHHTGDIQCCFDETFRILKKGGVAYLMVYNQRSYRQWRRWPKETFLSVLKDWDLLKTSPVILEEQKAAYDASASGAGAPETVFCSIATLEKMLNHFSFVTITKENCDDLGLGIGLQNNRIRLLPFLGKWLGLDLYIKAVK